MLASARQLEPLPSGHPCQGCEVRSLALCAVLESDHLARLKALGWTLKLPPGQTLFHEGDPATRVFTLTRGTLKLYKLLADGRRQVTGFLHPGDFLGISVDDEHAFSAEALEQSHAELRLEIRELMAQRRLREMQLIAGPGKRPVVGDGDDEPKVSRLELDHPGHPRRR